MLPGRVSMDMNSIPMVVRGCRLHPTQDVLLMPEGTLELNGPSRDVLARVDGNRNVAGIVQELLQEYEGAEEAEIRTDVLALLQDLKHRGVLRERT
jgi:pyrroloquinoline quinone biosynthesis protein D